MSDRSIAYVLKGYPGPAELFVASEIVRMDEQGLQLRLFVLPAPDEECHSPVGDRITSDPVYLTETSSLSNVPVVPWLLRNVKPFLPGLIRSALRRPMRTARAVAKARAQAIRARRQGASSTTYVKEFLLAIELADRLRSDREVVHLHAHVADETATMTWLCSVLTGLPYSFTGHAKDIYQSSVNPAGLLARKMKAAEFVVTCTEANRGHLQALAPDVPVHLIYHGLNAEFARLAANCCDRPSPERLRVISAGRLDDKKGFDVLVAAIELLVELGVDVELFIAGDEGESGPALRRQIADAGLQHHVSLLGPLNQADLFDQFQQASVFALASRVTDDGDRDGIPNVMMEAMATGLPVVATNVSGMPELIVDGTNGVLVAAESSSAVACGILRMYRDPALAARLGQAGREDVLSRFDGDVLASQMLDLFESVR